MIPEVTCLNCLLAELTCLCLIKHLLGETVDLLAIINFQEIELADVEDALSFSSAGSKMLSMI